jgi:hypothetical protein
MKYIIFGTALALFKGVDGGLVGIGTRNDSGPEYFDCKGKDGYYADRYRECKVFHRCLADGQKWR